MHQFPTPCTTACQGKYTEADPLYERSLAILEKVLGPEHPDLASSLNNRAELLLVQVKTTRKLPENISGSKLLGETARSLAGRWLTEPTFYWTGKVRRGQATF